jgi:hypothetical protein
MANNNGIFITKSGVALPVVTEMSLSAWSAYANNLDLALIKNTNHTFNAFEGFKYRVIFNSGNSGGNNSKVLFNAKGTYTAQVISGVASRTGSDGTISVTTEPCAIEEANKVFLVNSTLQVLQAALGAPNIDMRISSLDGDDYFMGNIQTGVWSVVTNNVAGASGDAGTQGVEFLLGDTFQIEVTDAAIVWTDETGSDILHSVARTWRGVLSASGLGTLTSSGTQTGSWQTFDLDDTFDSANTVISGTLTVESGFGQSTVYTVALGDDITINSLAGTEFFTMTANQSGSHEVSDDFSGGIGTIGYSVVSGALPTGVTLTSGGTIQGIPATDGESIVFIKIEDAGGNEETIEYHISVSPSANVSYNPPAGLEGVPYSYAPVLSGLTAASISGGSLPTGITLNGSTGALSGTPSVSGTFSFGITLDFGSISEKIDAVISVYSPMTAEVFADDASAGLVENGGSSLVTLQDSLKVTVDGGSGSYQYGISGGNLISSDGVITVFQSGEITVTVTDVVTGQIITFALLVAGQDGICGLAVEEEAGDESVNAPCVDIITNCNTPITVGFNSMHILKGIEQGETPYREYPAFDSMEGAGVTNSGKAFSMFRSKAPAGWAEANNARDGKAFLITFGVSQSVAGATGDVAVGVARKWDVQNAGLAGLDFAAVVTTVGQDRAVEIRKANVYQAGSRVSVLEGQEVGLAVYGDSVALYVDGLLKFQLSGNTFACSGVDIVFFAEQANMIIGGRASNLIYDISTTGTVDEVGTLDPQTGLYTPSLNNVSLVRISGVNANNSLVKYVANVRVIKPATKTSLEKAMLEGIPVDMWIAEEERFDDLPLRLDREGIPDRNQVKNPLHLGTLQGSGKMEMTQTRTDFRNDRGATSTSLTIDKVVITGAVLAVRDFNVVKRLVPYMKEYNAHGVRTLKQFSTGCHSRMRVFLIWQSPDCGDVPVFDAIEAHNALSYTPFNFEVGQAIQSNLPVSIEGFPNKDGVIFDYNQYDKAFHRIGEES